MMEMLTIVVSLARSFRVTSAVAEDVRPCRNSDGYNAFPCKGRLKWIIMNLPQQRKIIETK